MIRSSKRFHHTSPNLSAIQVPTVGLARDLQIYGRLSGEIWPGWPPQPRPRKRRKAMLRCGILAPVPTPSGDEETGKARVAERLNICMQCANWERDFRRP